MKNLKRLLTLGLVLTTCVSLVGCGGGSSSSGSASSTSEKTESTSSVSTQTAESPLAEAEAKAKDSGCDTLTIYTASNEDEFLLYATPFEQKYGITVDYVRLSQGELTSRVEAEAANPQASLVMGITDDSYIALQEGGLLEGYQTPVTSDVPDDFMLNVDGVDNSGWNPYFANVYVIACNEDWFSEHGAEYPKTWDDLLNPEFEGAVILPHPSTSGVGLFALNFMLQSRGEEEGWKFFDDLSSNVRQYAKGSSAAMMAVSLGEAALTVTGPQETLSAQEEGYPVYMDILDDVNGYSFSGISKIANGPSEESANAELFITWMLSEEGQSYVADAYRSPVNSNVESAEGMPNIGELNLFTIDAVAAASGKEDNIQKFMDNVSNTDDLKSYK